MQPVGLSLCFLLMLALPAVVKQSPTPKATPTPASQAVQSDSTSKKRASEPQEDTPTAPNSPAKILKYQHEETLKDLEKLVKLTAEVQEEVEKAGENVLPLATLKKLDDVEKLARKIRSRLKQ